MPCRGRCIGQRQGALLSWRTHVIQDTLAGLCTAVTEALREALAPDYILHGSNAAVRFETPAKFGDMAKYVVKESGITKARIIQTLNSGSALKGSSPLQASANATSGGRTIHNSLREILYGRLVQ